MPDWHTTWSSMRGANRGRVWMTWSEFDGLLRTLGLSLSVYHVRRALASSPPARVNGGKRYERHHVGLAAAYARSKGLTT